jgi:hypothetical protein
MNEKESEEYKREAQCADEKHDLELDLAEHRAESREMLSRAFGVTIQKIIRIREDVPVFQMHLPEGRLEFRGAAQFTSQKFVRNEIAGLTGKLIPRFKPDEWHSVAQQLLNACEDEPLKFNPDADLDAWFDQNDRISPQN